MEHLPYGTHIKAEGKLVARPHFVPRAFMEIKTVEAFLVIGADVKEKLKVKKTKIEEYPNPQLNVSISEIDHECYGQKKNTDFLISFFFF